MSGRWRRGYEKRGCDVTNTKNLGGSMSRCRAAVKSAVWVMAAGAAILAASDRTQAETPSGAPITIGFSMPLTGGLAVNGTSGLLAMQIWAEDTNKKGG